MERSRRRNRRRNSDQRMESEKKTSSERMGVLDAGAEIAAGVGAREKEPLRMRCCVAEAFLINSIVFPRNSGLIAPFLLTKLVSGM